MYRCDHTALFFSVFSFFYILFARWNKRSCNGRSVAGGGGGGEGGDYIFWVPNSLEGCDRWGEGWGVLYFKASVVQWRDIQPWRPELRPEGSFSFWEPMYMKQRSCDGRGARSAPFGMLNEPNKTGARSARARTRGQTH